MLVFASAHVKETAHGSKRTRMIVFIMSMVGFPLIPTNAATYYY
jgi:hypothetical protein